MLPKKNISSSDPPKWATSPAKALAERLLRDQSSWIHQTASVKVIHETEPLFKQYDFINFRTNLKNLRKRIQEEREAVDFDQRAFAKEKELFPRNPTTVKGNLFWDGHVAQKLMEEDVKAGRTRDVKPSVLQSTRVEYQDFPLSIVRQHKYKEERKEREAVYWVKKRNDKARKHHEKEVRDMEE